MIFDFRRRPVPKDEDAEFDEYFEDELDLDDEKELLELENEEEL